MKLEDFNKLWFNKLMLLSKNNTPLLWVTDKMDSPQKIFYNFLFTLSTPMEIFPQAKPETLKNNSQRWIMNQSHWSEKNWKTEDLLEYGNLAHCPYY